MLRTTPRRGALPSAVDHHVVSRWGIPSASHHSAFHAHQQQRVPVGNRAPTCAASPSSAPIAPQNTQQPAQLYDCISLGNLCVDVVLQVPTLPDADVEARRQLLSSLSASPPDVSTWEVGGACNFMIAAARLGMDIGCIGQLGDDQPGQFLRQVMQNEGVSDIQPLLPVGRTLPQTLLCFVLVSPTGGHVFCSSYDFGPWPIIDGAVEIPEPVMQMLQRTRALYLNGFVFDELEPSLVAAVARVARDAGAAVFFDPGPRCWTLRTGPRRAALDALLSLSDVVLMTEDEAAAMTDRSDPREAAQWVLQRPGAVTQWAVVKAGAAGALLYAREEGGAFEAQAYQVDVRDTVGCGDSFAAAVVLGYLANHSVPTVMALANAVGAATAMGMGAGRNVASVDNVVNLLQASIDYTSSSEEDPCVHRQALQLLQGQLASTDQPTQQ